MAELQLLSCLTATSIVLLQRSATCMFMTTFIDKVIKLEQIYPVTAANTFSSCMNCSIHCMICIAKK